LHVKATVFDRVDNNDQKKHKNASSFPIELWVDGQYADMTEKLLHIYLDDHFAGSVAGRELAKRTLSNNQGTPLGDFLAELVSEIHADQGHLADVMDTIGAPRHRAKRAAAWTAERVGRLKLNGQARGYSPLSRVVELEGLTAGVTSKLSLWKVLHEIARTDPRLARFDFDALIARATKQLDELEEHRIAAAREAFGVTGASGSS
jgi:hypothetical protein